MQTHIFRVKKCHIKYFVGLKAAGYIDICTPNGHIHSLIGHFSFDSLTFIIILSSCEGENLLLESSETYFIDNVLNLKTV